MHLFRLPNIVNASLTKIKTAGYIGMATGKTGTFLVSWSQAELDGMVGTDPSAIAAGSTWRWSGRASRIDDPRDILVLENALGVAETHRRAADKIRRILRDISKLAIPDSSGNLEQPLFKNGFELTDGREQFSATLIDLENGQYPMLLFAGSLPPADQDLWVVSCNLSGDLESVDPVDAGMVCFIPSTRIRTPNGMIPLFDLSEGDLICTRDNGNQEIKWMGNRKISGGRLIALPHLRPIRFNAHVLADGQPDEDLYLSPDHRVMVKGAVAQSLFNTPEVLVTARDLINDSTIRVNENCRGVEYVHLMLDTHSIVWANGIEVESFHPAGMPLENIDEQQKHSLSQRFPDVIDDAYSYGEFARRTLTTSEAALLTYGAQTWH